MWTLIKIITFCVLFLGTIAALTCTAFVLLFIAILGESLF